MEPHRGLLGDIRPSVMVFFYLTVIEFGYTYIADILRGTLIPLLSISHANYVNQTASERKTEIVRVQCENERVGCWSKWLNVYCCVCCCVGKGTIIMLAAYMQLLDTKASVDGAC